MTKLEEIARAIRAEAKTFSDPVWCYVEGEAKRRATEEERDQIKDWDLASWVILARAAVEAMREPTEAMEDAGYEMLPDDVPNGASECCWRAMVAAILNEKPE